MTEAKCTVPGDADDGVVLQVRECLVKDYKIEKVEKENSSGRLYC